MMLTTYAFKIERKTLVFELFLKMAIIHTHTLQGHICPRSDCHMEIKFLVVCWIDLFLTKKLKLVKN